MIAATPCFSASLNERALFDIFTLAIAKEREAQELYRRAAELAGSGTPLHARFMAFVEEERAHEESLVADYGDFKMKLVARRDA